MDTKKLEALSIADLWAMIQIMKPFYFSYKQEIELVTTVLTKKYDDLGMDYLKHAKEDLNSFNT